MGRNVLLVYPRIPTTYWSYKYALPFVRKKALLPPLGLLTVAAMLPEDYCSRLVDMNVSDLKPKDIEWADLVFLSAMLVQSRSFEQVVTLCREHGKTVVAGGPYPISSYGRIEGVDHFVLDEAELTLPQFLRDLERGQARSLYRDERKPDLSLTPLPRFDLVDIKAYESMPLQFSRGCPFECEFCDIIEMFGRRPRTKAVPQFLAEVEHVYGTGFRGSLFIVDDNFVGNKLKVKELLRPLASWQRAHGYPFAISTEASINLAQDEELLDLMVAAGFTMVFVGIETPDVETLALTNKRQNLREDALGSIVRIQGKGLEVSGGFIVGFDGESQDIFERQRAFIQSAGIPTAMMGLLVALPNTQLYRRLEREGRILSETHGNNTHNFELNFVPQMPREELLAGYKWLIGRMYSARSFFQRSLTLMKRLGRAGRGTDQAPAGERIVRKIRSRDILPLLRSLFRQGFSYYGFHYLRFLIQVVLYDFSLFPRAVTVAVRGHHFIRITREILRADAFTALIANARAVLSRELSNIARAGQRIRIRELEQRVRVLLRPVQRTYRSLSRGVQQLVEEAFYDFEQRCQKALQHIRLTRA